MQTACLFDLIKIKETQMITDALTNGVQELAVNKPSLLVMCSLNNSPWRRVNGSCSQMAWPIRIKRYINCLTPQRGRLAQTCTEFLPWSAMQAPIDQISIKAST